MPGNIASEFRPEIAAWNRSLGSATGVIEKHIVADSRLGQITDAPTGVLCLVFVWSLQRRVS
jgi:hypothetical protein